MPLLAAMCCTDHPTVPAADTARFRSGGPARCATSRSLRFSLHTNIRSGWGQRLGQEKAASENSNLRKAKVLEIRRFRGLLVRREGFEPPAFWSVCCLKGRSESFRLRFVLFAAIRSADFPLFPSSPARFFRVLGQKWVKGCNIRRDWRTATLRHSPHYLSSYHKWRKRQRFVGIFFPHRVRLVLADRAEALAANIVVGRIGVEPAV